jgi:hypothetical protein
MFPFAIGAVVLGYETVSHMPDSGQTWPVVRVVPRDTRFAAILLVYIVIPF